MINNKLNKKSVKMHDLDKKMATLLYRKESRWVKVWKDAETENYMMHAGYDGQPADFKLEMTEIEELEDEMRECANLRSWVYSNWD